MLYHDAFDDKLKLIISRQLFFCATGEVDETRTYQLKKNGPRIHCKFRQLIQGDFT